MREEPDTWEARAEAEHDDGEHVTSHVGCPTCEGGDLPEPDDTVSFPVVGPDPFPLAALCTAEAWPARQRDAETIRASMNSRRVDDVESLVTLHSRRQPEAFDWEPFGWAISPEPF